MKVVLNLNLKLYMYLTSVPTSHLGLVYNILRDKIEQKNFHLYVFKMNQIYDFNETHQSAVFLMNTTNY